MFDLTGKVALVTGASGGIGGAIAKALHAQGATLALTGTREEALAAVVAELGSRAEAFPCDLSDAEASQALPGRVEAGLGSLDILVNNAGITRDNLLLRMKEEEWRQVLSVNLDASFRLSKAVLRGMMKRRWGRIVSITSVVGTTRNPGQANYAAAKAGLVGFTKSLAQEVASRGITVNCVAPGFIQTAMTDKLDEGQKGRLNEVIPAGRIGQPDDIGPAVVYLASEEAAYVTGQSLHVNGGMTMI